MSRRLFTLAVLLPVALVAVNLASFLKQVYTVVPDDPPAQQCQADEGQALGRFAEFLTFKTLGDPQQANGIRAGYTDQFTQALAFLEDAYPDVYSQLKVERVGAGGWSLLITWQGSQPELEPVLFVSHYDVVPVTEGTEQHWKHPPFAGIIADGFVWGRGALDVKITLMALMEAATRLIKQQYTPKRTIMFCFGHDEELGGMTGAAQVAQLLQDRGVKLDVVVDEGGIILLDGVKGLTTHPVALVGTAEKMYTSVMVTLHARGGHSSMPPLDGSDIGSQMGRLLSHVSKNPPAPELRAPIPDFLKALAPYAPAPLKPILAAADVWPVKKLLARLLSKSSGEVNALVSTTVVATRIAAGVADNVAPNTGLISFNMRSHPSVPTDEAVQYIQQAVRVSRAQAEVAVSNLTHFGSPSAVTAAHGRHFLLLKHTLQSYWRHGSKAVAVAPYLMVGGTDSKHFNHLTRHGVLRLGPYGLNKTAGEVSLIHSTNERLRVGDYALAICTFQRLLEVLSRE